MGKKIVTLHCVYFKGVFGRNRSVKFTCNSPFEAVTDAAGNTPLRELVATYAQAIGAKRGWVGVTRYDNCEIIDNDVQVIPITQGVDVIRAEVLNSVVDFGQTGAL